MHRTGLGATKQMVFAIIDFLKDLEGRPRPSWRWFQNYIKTTPGFLHTLKTKPIVRNRVGAQDVKDVQDWFKSWMTWCEAHDIQHGDIINFDEAGFQIGVASGEDILVPTWIVDPLYTRNPENRRSITVIESIIANGTTIPPVLIVQCVNHMTNWYTLLDGNTRVLMSDSGYINSQLALEYLDNLILHIQAGANACPRVLLMDQHGSHMTPEFIIKATEANIHPFPSPSHLTHVLQPLDVGVFQPYKHWHQKAVQDATRHLDIEYTVSSFFWDLTEIREKTVKKETIQGAFRKSGIWPINCQKALKKMKTYMIPAMAMATATVIELPCPQTPVRGVQAKRSLQEIASKISEKIDIFSSPTRRKIDSTIRGVQNVLMTAEVRDRQYEDLHNRVQNQQKFRIRGNRKVLQKGGVLTGTQARQIQDNKHEKEHVDKIKR